MTTPWKDITSYSRDDKERKPQTFEKGVGDLRIVITCGHIYHRPNWVMHCGALNIDTRRLLATTQEEAQIEAVAIVGDTLTRLTANFYQIRGKKK